MIAGFNVIAIAVTWLATAVSLLAVDLVVPGVDISSFSIALVAAIAVGFVNAFVKPVVTVLTLPFNLLTLGLFSFVVNGICLWLASAFVSGFTVRGPLAFIFGPVILSLVNAFLSRYLGERTANLTEQQ